MKVCLIGHFNENIQEGVRNVSKKIAESLENKGVSIYSINVGKILPWLEIRKFNPDIIHFILTPTIGGLIIAKITALFCGNSKIVISAIHNSLSKPNFLINFLAPDLILVQSTESELFYKHHHFPVSLLFNGVDTKKFQPSSLERKKQLRKQMNFTDDDFILLHLASFTPQRNLSVFPKIIDHESCKVLLIGRPHEIVDLDLIDELKKNGCRIEIKFFENIEDIYHVADCYVFPTIEKNACIETPLSVIEAMSCNMPVITTRFGALPLIFNSKINGLYFVEDIEEYTNCIRNIREHNPMISTRDAVDDLSWDKISNTLLEKYEELYLS
jgi:glycosyltransferase involved in cell wall biosynthesis